MHRHLVWLNLDLYYIWEYLSLHVTCYMHRHLVWLNLELYYIWEYLSMCVCARTQYTLTHTKIKSSKKETSPEKSAYCLSQKKKKN